MAGGEERSARARQGVEGPLTTDVVEAGPDLCERSLFSSVSLSLSPNTTQRACAGNTGQRSQSPSPRPPPAQERERERERERDERERDAGEPERFPRWRRRASAGSSPARASTRADSRALRSRPRGSRRRHPPTWSDSSPDSWPSAPTPKKKKQKEKKMPARFVSSVKSSRASSSFPSYSRVLSRCVRACFLCFGKRSERRRVRWRIRSRDAWRARRAL